MRIEPYLREYEKLKEEQVGRIKVRDNLLYANLVAVGVLAAKAMDQAELWLLVPWIGCILGWTYLMNKDQVLRIKQYLGGRLAPVVRDRGVGDDVFAWERVERGLPARVCQFFIEEVAFVAPGAASLFIFTYSDPPAALPERWASGVVMFEAALLGILAVQFAGCEFFRRRKMHRPEPLRAGTPAAASA
jgi:hypothetical protein